MAGDALKLRNWLLISWGGVHKPGFLRQSRQEA